MQNKITVAVVTIGILALGLFAVTGANAQTSDKQNSIVQKIAQTFGLDQAKVQAVFDQEHQVHMADMQKRMDEKLSQAVKDGKITEAQKQAIIAKMTELKAAHKQNMDAFKNMTPEQRKQTMEKQQADLKAWAQSQGIDPAYLMMKGMGGKMGFKMHAK